ncbi:siderophore ABC transporter substrate-binding protein [Flaviflexus huanghaiensis]|uniref:siderophore ABC transporter substrate-binding protein n=1 Tax=Flaviflexus huanghaiensis TaxID=1111473 RepID=UPI0015FD865B|nr:ABC transporter substrate-binding protein [Flaviflexus huanghaiensis]
MSIHSRSLSLVAVAAAAALTLSACGEDTADAEAEATRGASTSEETTDPADSAASTVTDMAGNTVELPADPQSIIATDNRIFGTLADWGIELSAAPIDIMPVADESLSVYTESDELENLGNHREPNMEAFITVQPDLILNGQRFAQYEQDIRDLVGDAAFVSTDVDVENVPIDDGLRELTSLLGDIFGRQADAEQLISDFDESIERAAESYDSDQTVVGLMTTGGSINYVAPSTGRTIGPVFDVLGLTPALDRAGSSNHQGDDISVEAIADANPDWIVVLDRDAGAGTEGAASAKEIIAESEALAGVTAVKEGNIIYLDPNFYVAEDIQHYTGLFNQMADAFQAK